MAFEILDSESTSLDLAAGATVLTHVVPETRVCSVSIRLGDGVKDLDGNGGDFEVTVFIDDNAWLGGPDLQELGSEPRALLQTQSFVVLAGEEVSVQIKSPNVADTDVAVAVSLVSEETASVLDVTAARNDIIAHGDITWLTPIYDDSSVLEAIGSIDAKLVGRVVTSQPVVGDGEISSPVIIGDDYLSRHARHFRWSVTPPPNVDVADASCQFGARHQSLGDSFLVEGTVSEEADHWVLAFDLPRVETDGMRSGQYDWSVQLKDEQGAEITTIRGKLEMRSKQT
ncbi:hypothetical protein [Novipirellula artificiosorum]|uniref:Uncharacterized protein n=1 Tax=Novipirellula artificiosorum TaxID=2528016 RepID=A0A5C6DS29_9BACT|nr:hypothetical protein [Novipirellula artificiosorum]TWU39482.1 hypothetical protein Poly41_23060 [Novipirellula artificiosorum]